MFGSTILEPIIINFIYFKNIDLFLDLILTRKNQERLVKRIIELENEKYESDYDL